MKGRGQAVTVVAVLLMAWFGMGAILGGLQLALVVFVMPHEAADEALRDPELVGQFPPAFRYVLARLPWVMAGIWAMTAATAVCAYGVWKRREWARVGMIVLLGLHMALACAGPALAVSVMTHAGTPKLPGAMGRVPYAFVAIAMIPSLLYVAGFGWFGYQLTRAEVREEFG